MKIKSFSHLNKELQKKIDKALDKVLDSSNMKEIGDDLADEIRVRTRLGYSVDSNNSLQKKLKPLAESTIKHRQNLKKQGKLHQDTTPKRSNLTMTGEMTDSIKAKPEKGGIKITANKTAKYHENTRPFLHLDKNQVKKWSRKIQQQLKSILERLL